MGRDENRTIEPLTGTPPWGSGVGIEELEARLETQEALARLFDAADCLYFLCTTRCSGTKCPVFCACDLVVE